MRRLKLVLGVAALMVAIMAASAAPAAAQGVFISGDGFCDGFEDDEDCFDDFLFFDEFCDDFDGDFICDFEDFDDGFVDFGDGAIEQDVEQEAESGDIDQDFGVSQTGDNSNQTVSTQGVANTGNAQNATGVIQVGGDADDFEFEDGGSEIELSPTNTTNSSNQVNQSAAVSDDD
jgi:hypothetical protein